MITNNPEKKDSLIIKLFQFRLFLFNPEKQKDNFNFWNGSHAMTLLRGLMSHYHNPPKPPKPFKYCYKYYHKDIEPLYHCIVKGAS